MTHEKLLDAYAQLAVRTGLNLQKDQQLVITERRFIFISRLKRFISSA